MDVRFILEDIKILLICYNSVTYKCCFCYCFFESMHHSSKSYLYIFFVTVIWKRSNKFKGAITPNLKHVLMT